MEQLKKEHTKEVRQLRTELSGLNSEYNRLQKQLKAAGGDAKPATEAGGRERRGSASSDKKEVAVLRKEVARLETALKASASSRLETAYTHVTADTPEVAVTWV